MRRPDGLGRRGAWCERLLVLLLGVVCGLKLNTSALIGDLQALSRSLRSAAHSKDPRRLTDFLRATSASRSAEQAPARTPKNLVFCLADGVEYQGAAGIRWLARFAGSFRRYNSDADLVFFTTAVDPAIADKLAAVSMRAVLFGNETPPWDGIEVAARRWHIMRRYLEKHQSELDGGWVLAIDARDSFFQADPFAYPRAPSDELYVFLEGTATAENALISNALRNNDWNSKVVKACYPNLTETSAGDGPVSCSGTVMGTHAAMLRYMRLMEGEMLRTASDPVCNVTGGRDQGYHNVLLHTGALARHMTVTMHNNFDGGIVLTTGDGYALVDFLGRVLNGRGEVPAVVHQWDRVGQIFAMIDNTMFPTLLGPEFYVLPDTDAKKRRSRAEVERYVLGRARNGSAVQ